MQNSEWQELFLAVMPQWHHWMAKPFKQMLEEEVSLGMYYTIQILRRHGDTMTMTELARSAHCSKQQMTKTVSKLIESGLAQRLPDPSDRRIIRLKLTQEGQGFTDRFLQQAAGYYQPMLDSMPEADRKVFFEALQTLHQVFDRMPDDSHAA